MHICIFVRIICDTQERVERHRVSSFAREPSARTAVGEGAIIIGAKPYSAFHLTGIPSIRPIVPPNDTFLVSYFSFVTYN